MKAQNSLAIGRFIRANRVPLAALLALGLIAGCEVGGARLVGPTTTQNVSPTPARVALIATETRLTTSSTLALRAVALNAAGDTLTGSAFTWNSSDPLVAAVSAGGIVTAMKAGTASITASTGSVTSNALALTVVDATVTPPTVSTLSISAPGSSIGTSATLQATALARDSNGNLVSGAAVTWSSSNPQVATVSSTGLITGVAAGSANISASSGAVSSNTLTITVTAPAVNHAVASITVSAGASSLLMFQLLQAQAVALDASGNVVTGVSFTWASSNTLVATVSGTGGVIGVSAGTVTITATSGSVTSNALALTVASPPVATITVSAPASSLVLQQTVQAQAVARDASGHILQGIAFTWASSNAQVAKVSSAGLITGVAAGSASISASSGGINSNALAITVVPPGVASVTVTAGASSLLAFGTLQAQAVARDGIGNVITGVSFAWASSNTLVATVDGNGNVTGVAPGAATITAMAGPVISNALALTVTNPPVATITATAPSSSLTLLTQPTVQAQAVAHDASGHVLQGITFTWASSNAPVATVSSTGLITAVAAGSANISASSGGINSNALAITVVPPTVASVTVTAGASSLLAFGTLQAQAVAHDASNNVITGASFTWASSNTLVATVDGTGNVTGVGPGAVTITAMSGSVTSNALALTVTNPPVATITASAPSSSLTLLTQPTVQAQAVAQDASGHVLQGIVFTWSSTNAPVATVSSTGLITAVAAGSANISASSGGINSNALAITVLPPVVASVTVTAGTSSLLAFGTLQAQAVAHDASNNVITGVSFTWASSNALFATVDGTGNVTGVAPGAVTITATSGSVTSNALALTVTNPPVATITASAPLSSLSLQQTDQGQAVAKDGSGHVLQGIVFTWSSTNAPVATVSSTGLITAVAAGSANISASSGGINSNALAITVVPPTVASVTVTAGASSLLAFGTLQAQAVAFDASNNVITGVSFTWTSSDTHVATVDGNGNVTGVAPGAVTITATAGSVTSNALALTVTNPPVATITVSAPSSSLSLLGQPTVQAQAVAQDASGNVLQGIVFTWSSSNPVAAVVSSDGLITAVVIGTSDITATSGSVTSAAFTVTVVP